MKRFWFSSAAGALAVISILAVSVACHKDHGVVPDELIGSWTTEEAVYQGRAVKLEKDYLLIGFGEDVNPTVQRITKVETDKIPTGEACTIYSMDKEGTHKLTVFFDPSDGGFVFFKNVRGKWRKQKTM